MKNPLFFMGQRAEPLVCSEPPSPGRSCRLARVRASQAASQAEAAQAGTVTEPGGLERRRIGPWQRVAFGDMVGEQLVNLHSPKSQLVKLLADIHRLKKAGSLASDL